MLYFTTSAHNNDTIQHSSHSSSRRRGGHCSNSSLPVRVRTQTGVFERLLLKSYTKSFLNYEPYVRIEHVKEIITRNQSLSESTGEIPASPDHQCCQFNSHRNRG